MKIYLHFSPTSSVLSVMRRHLSCWQSAPCVTSLQTSGTYKHVLSPNGSVIYAQALKRGFHEGSSPKHVPSQHTIKKSRLARWLWSYGVSVTVDKHKFSSLHSKVLQYLTFKSICCSNPINWNLQQWSSLLNRFYSWRVNTNVTEPSETQHPLVLWRWIMKTSIQNYKRKAMALSCHLVHFFLF